MINFDLRFVKVVGGVVWFFGTASSRRSNDARFYGDRVSVAGNVLAGVPDVCYIRLLAAVGERAGTFSVWA